MWRGRRRMGSGRERGGFEVGAVPTWDTREGKEVVA